MIKISSIVLIVILQKKNSLQTKHMTYQLKKMRETLQLAGLDCLISDPASDIIDWYDTYITKKQLIYKDDISNK